MIDSKRDSEPRSEPCRPEAGAPCAVCADEAWPGVVRSIDAARGVAAVERGGGLEEVAIDLMDGVVVGDVLMVHLGFAIGRTETP